MQSGIAGIGNRTLTIDPYKYGTQQERTASSHSNKRTAEEMTDAVSQGFFQVASSPSGKHRRRRKLCANVAPLTQALSENVPGSPSLPQPDLSDLSDQFDQFNQCAQEYIAGSRKGSKESKKRKDLVAFLRQQLKENPSELVISSSVKYLDLSLLNSFSELKHLKCQMSKLEKFCYGEEATCKIDRVSFISAERLKLIKIDGLTGLSELDFSSCTALETLKINQSPQLSSVSISGLLRLTSVDLSANPHLTDLQISKCDSIKEIRAINCPELQRVGVSECLRLKSIDLSGATQLSQFDLVDAKALESLNLTGAQVLVNLDLSSAAQLKELYCSYLDSLKCLYLPSDSKIRFMHNDALTEKISKLISLNRNVFHHLGVEIHTIENSERLFSFDRSVHEWIARLGNLHEFTSDSVEETTKKTLQRYLLDIIVLGCSNSSYAAMMKDIMEDALISCEDRIALSIFDLCRYMPIYSLITSINTFAIAEEVALSSIDGLEETHEEHDQLASLGVEALYSNLFLMFKVKETALTTALEVAAQDPGLYASESELLRGSIAHKEELAVYVHLASEVNQQYDDPFYIPSMLYSGEGNSGVEDETVRDIAYGLVCTLTPQETTQKKEVMKELCDFLVDQNGRSDVVRDLLLALHNLGLFTGIPDFRTFFADFQESFEGDAEHAYDSARKAYKEQCDQFEPSDNETPYELKYKRRKAYFS